MSGWTSPSQELRSRGGMGTESTVPGAFYCSQEHVISIQLLRFRLSNRLKPTTAALSPNPLPAASLWCCPSRRRSTWAVALGACARPRRLPPSTRLPDTAALSSIWGFMNEARVGSRPGLLKIIRADGSYLQFWRTWGGTNVKEIPM